MILPLLGGALLGGVVGSGAVIGTAATAATIAAGAGIGASVGGQLYGGQKASQAARDQANMSNEAAMRRLGYDTEKWELDKEMIKANRLHAMEEIKAKARNEGRVADYQDASNKQQYEYQLQIRDRQQASNEQQFQRSEKIFSDQLSLNERSQLIAEDNEYRQLEEIHTEQAFEKEAAYIESIQKQGKLRALGIKGRSAQKGYQVTAADFGRQIAQLNEAFSSAGRNTRSVLREIANDRASADLAAEAQRMLDPGILPQPLKPLDTPRAEFVLPRELQEFDFGPKPVLGAMASPSAAANRVWGSTIAGIAGTVGQVATGFIPD